MRILYNRIIIWLITTQFFCCGMEEKGLVFVTDVDKKTALFKKSKIKQSSVLSLLYAYQKKHSSNAIIIPRACREIDDISAKDVRLLRCLLDNQADAFVLYMNKLSYNDRIHSACAAYRLGAQRQLAQVVDYFFLSDISTNIRLKMISNDVQEYMIKQIIKKREIIDHKNGDEVDRDLCSCNNGAIYYIPLEIVHYKDDIFFDGITPIVAELSFEGQGDLTIGAMSCKGNYYVTGVKKSDNDKAVLWHSKNNMVVKSKQKIVGNDGKITQVVFDRNETCLVMGSNHEENNLFCWKLDPCNDEGFSYCLQGYDGAVGKVIINDEGTCILLSDKYKADVIVWDIVRKVTQLLYDNYTHPITAMAFASNGKQLWVCSGSIISLWQKPDGGDFVLEHTMNLHDDAIICRLLVNEKAGYIVVGRTDGKLNVICIHTNKEIVCLAGHKNSPINGLIGNGVGNVVVSSTNDIANNLMMWDISTGKRLANLVGHPGISAILLTPDMRYIVSQSWQHTYLWKMYGKSEEKSLQYIKNKLSFWHCYELYSLCKMKKNGYKVERSKINWVLSLPAIAGVKSFVERYLL